MAPAPSLKDRVKRHWPRVIDLAPWWLIIIGLTLFIVVASILGPDPAPYMRPE